MLNARQQRDVAGPRFRCCSRRSVKPVRNYGAAPGANERSPRRPAYVCRTSICLVDRAGPTRALLGLVVVTLERVELRGAKRATSINTSPVVPAARKLAAQIGKVERCRPVPGPECRANGRKQRSEGGPGYRSAIGLEVSSRRGAPCEIGNAPDPGSVVSLSTVVQLREVGIDLRERGPNGIAIGTGGCRTHVDGLLCHSVRGGMPVRRMRCSCTPRQPQRPACTVRFGTVLEPLAAESSRRTCSPRAGR